MKASMLALVLAAAALAGCSVVQEAADATARDTAKGVVNGVVAERFRGVDASPVTDCVIDAASAQEILRIAGAAVTGVTEDTVGLVLDIAQRPDAVECIARGQLGALLG